MKVMLKPLHASYVRLFARAARNALVLALFGCAVRPDAALCALPAPSSWQGVSVLTPVWVDAAFPPVKRDAVEQAMSDWNAVLNGYYRFVIASEEMFVPSGGFTAGTRTSLGWGLTIEYVLPVPDTINPSYLAWLWRGSVIQFFPTHFSSEDYRIVAKHELGHFLGLDDNEPKSTLMHTPYSYDQWCIDSGTVAIVARKHHWAPEKLKPECVSSPGY